MGKKTKPSYHHRKGEKMLPPGTTDGSMQRLERHTIDLEERLAITTDLQAAAIRHISRAERDLKYVRAYLEEIDFIIKDSDGEEK